MNYTKIASELNSELNGFVERCDCNNRDGILWSNPAVHLDRRYNPNNVAIVYLDKPISKADIKNELLSHWFVRQVFDRCQRITKN